MNKQTFWYQTEDMNTDEWLETTDSDIMSLAELLAEEAYYDDYADHYDWNYTVLIKDIMGVVHKVNVTAEASINFHAAIQKD